MFPLFPGRLLQQWQFVSKKKDKNIIQVQIQSGTITDQHGMAL